MPTSSVYKPLVWPLGWVLWLPMVTFDVVHHLFLWFVGVDTMIIWGRGCLRQAVGIASGYL